MGTAFTQQEKEAIRKALIEAGFEYAATLGMRKTSVDQLAEYARISKGAFYKFYETKEHLFFELLESWHCELYDAAWEKWKACEGMELAERATETLMEAYRLIDKRSMMKFIEEDIPCLLRKMPPEELEKHYHSDDVHLKELLCRMDIKLKKPLEFVSEVIRALFLTLAHREQIGGDYPEVLKLLIAGACAQLV